MKILFSKNLSVIEILLILMLITLTHQHKLKKHYSQKEFTHKKFYEKNENLNKINSTADGLKNDPDKLNNNILMTVKKHEKFKDNNTKNLVHHVRGSIPIRLFQCIRKLSLLRCMKLFLLQKMELQLNYKNTGNLTEDFINQFLTETYNLPSLINQKYQSLNDTELTNRLIYHLQNFFKDREVKLQFIPGIVIKLKPSKDNKIQFSFKTNDIGNGRKKKNKKTDYKHTMIQMALPVMVMPAILMGTFLPFMIPVFKMATLMSMVLNNGALLAAIMYAARTHAQQNEAEIVHYSHAGYAH